MFTRTTSIIAAIFVACALLITSASTATAKSDRYNNGYVWNDGGKIYGNTLSQKFTARKMPAGTTIITRAQKCDGKWVQFKVVDRQGNFSYNRSYATKNFPKEMKFYWVIKSPGYAVKRTSYGYTHLGDKYAGC